MTYVFQWKGHDYYIRNHADEVVVREQALYLRNLDLRAGDVVLDIGANIGATAVALGPYVSHFIAAEPEPDNIALYMQNIQGRVQSTLYEAAIVGNTDTSRTLYLAENNPSNHSLYVHGKRVPITVPAININALLAQHACDIWKIDAEGAEYELLMAIESPFWEAPRELMLEFHHSILHDRTQEKYRATLARIKQFFPYVRYREDPGKNWHTMILASKARVL